MARSHPLLALLLSLGACGEDETPATSDTGAPEVVVYAACDFPEEHTCANLLDARQAVVWDTYDCDDSGGVVLDGECPRDALIGGCLLTDVEHLYLEGYDGHPLEYLMSYCAESDGVWVEE